MIALLLVAGTLAGASTPLQELAGLYIGEPLTNATAVFTAQDRRIVQATDMKFQQPYTIHNLIDPKGHIYGNVGVCRGRINAIIVDVVTYDELMKLLRLRIEQFGQPRIKFEAIEASDGSTADEDIRYDWPNGYTLSFPVGEPKDHLGAQMLGRSKCT